MNLVELSSFLSSSLLLFYFQNCVSIHSDITFSSIGTADDVSGKARRTSTMFLITSEDDRIPTRLLLSSITHSRCFFSLVKSSAASLILVPIVTVKAESVINSPTVVATIFRAATIILCCSSGSSISNGSTAPVSSF
jgi:hypothetical protein